MKMLWVGIILLCALLLSNGAHAVNKCVDANGKITYQDRPCPTAANTKEVKIRADTPTGIDAVKAEQRLQQYKNEFNQAKIKRQQRIRRRALSAQRRQVGKKYDDEVAAIDKRACQRFTLGYKDFESKKRAGYTRGEEQHLDNMMARYKQSMDQYCR